MESYSVVSTTSVEFVTVAEMKTHCRVLHDDDDTYFASVTAAARAYAETFTNRSLINRSVLLTLDEFPTGDQIIHFKQYLPVRSITSIIYYDANGTTQSTTEYTLDTVSEASRLYPEHNEDWPTVWDYQNVIAITFAAGPATSTGQEWYEQCHHAVKIIGYDTYKHRGSIIPGRISPTPLQIPASANALLWQARVFRP